MRNWRWTGLVAVCAMLAGCNAWPMHEETRRASAPWEAAVAGLDVATRNGSVTITPGDVGEVRITARLRARTPERLADMRVVAQENAAGVLEVRVEPPAGGWKSNEGCAIDIVTPEGLASATVRTHNGRIEVAGVRGAVDAETSNGSIEVSDVEGRVRADTSNGRIVLASVGGPVEAETSNGGISVRLRDDATGPVRLGTSNGSVSLEVGEAFAGTASLDTSNGSVTLPPASACTVVKKARHSATLQFAPGGGESVIDTSNGSITVTRR